MLEFGFYVVDKILNNGCGIGRVKVVAISAITDDALQIAVVTVWINHKHIYY